MAHIKKYAPPSGSLLQKEWVLKHCKAIPGPVYGWPMTYVQQCCEIKAKEKLIADAEFEFVNTIFGLKGVFITKICPIVIPYLRDHGLFGLGRPSAGKTPFAIIHAQAVGEYWIKKEAANGGENDGAVDVKPGWLRCKQFDDIREANHSLHVGVIIDDPNMHKVVYENTNNFLDAGFQGHVNARYNPAKLVKNQSRTILDNAWDEEKEPRLSPDVDRIAWDLFYPMIMPAFSCP